MKSKNGDGAALSNEEYLGEEEEQEAEEEEEEAMEETRKSARNRGREAPMSGGELLRLRDPLVVLGSDVFLLILSRLDALSAALSLLVSHGWYRLASGDRIWSSKVENLWFGKAHIPRSSMLRGTSKLEAYSNSMADGFRTRLVKEDLCDHVWEFRFKKTAPDYWLNLDPSWKGNGPPMHRYFQPNGSQTAGSDDKVWGGHECAYSIVTSFVEGRIREHYVRINRWPALAISRKPDWSWEMSNHMCCYLSVPDAGKEGGTGPLFPVW